MVHIESGFLKQHFGLFLANCFCRPADRQFFVSVSNSSVVYYGECLSVVAIASVQNLAELNCRRRNASLAQILSYEKSQFLKGN
jgi:hypothetical protein